MVQTCGVKSALLFPILIALIAGAARAGVAPVFADPAAFRWRGSEEFGRGLYQAALDSILTDTAVSDSGFHYFKLGCTYQHLGDWSRALYFFSQVAGRHGTFSPFAFESIGEIELEQKRYEGALKSLRAAADYTTLMPYRYRLYRTMYGIAVKHADTLGAIPWLEQIVSADAAIPDTAMKMLLIRLIESGGTRELDSALQEIINPGSYTAAQCFICDLLAVDTLPDTVFSVKTLYRVSELAYTCRKYRVSGEWLDAAAKRKNFADSVPRKQYLLHRTRLCDKTKDYDEVVKWGRQYDKLHGPEPEVLFALARAYRFLGRQNLAAHWYDRHIAQFPHHTQTYDILWYRAWQFEDANKFDKARQMYDALAESSSSHRYGEEAAFRRALTFCKERNFETARQEYGKFMNRFASSSIISAARYWKARCSFAVQDQEKAREECLDLIVKDPDSYYAHRARELVALMGDSAVVLAVDTARSDDQVAEWLDSISDPSRQALAPVDSARLYLGLMLSSLRMTDRADLVLQPLENLYADDLSLLYTLARFYRASGDPTRSYRVSRRFAWRIPPQHRARMPEQIYSLLYPGAFDDYITRSAQAMRLEPELVRAVIRQESIFNPSIVSPAGAIGLMQIMPFTGEEIARDLHEPFVLDSLYSPAKNIAYGSFYLRKLLDQFNGDVVLAIAGYNGGPHNARKWRAQNDDDGFDMFVEDIGFSETRTYVKKVMGNYWTYKTLGKIR
jgi:soluble lytic murein transglycosylase-like protein